MTGISASWYLWSRHLPCDLSTRSRLGRIAASLARGDGLTGTKVRETFDGRTFDVYIWPERIWDRAYDFLTGYPAAWEPFVIVQREDQNALG